MNVSLSPAGGGSTSTINSFHFGVDIVSLWLETYFYCISFFCLPKRKKQRKGQPKTNAPLFLAGQRT
jgi:hypothetical protein